MMALGIGLSLNNARAVVEGLFGRESEFVRTPKHGVTAKTQTWTKAKYRVSKNVYSWLEFGFGLYFVATNGIHGRELWVTDGTPAGTRLAHDLVPGPGSPVIRNPAADSTGGGAWATNWMGSGSPRKAAQLAAMSS